MTSSEFYERLSAVLVEAGWTPPGSRSAPEPEDEAPEAPVTRERVRDSVLAAAATPDGRAVVQAALSQFAVRRAGELKEEDLAPFLRLIELEPACK